MQVSFFDDGSFVAHRIRRSGRFYSAWFTAEGVLKDLEQTGREEGRSGRRIPLQINQTVPTTHVHVRADIQTVGSGIHRNRDAYRV